MLSKKKFVKKFVMLWTIPFIYILTNVVWSQSQIRYSRDNGFKGFYYVDPVEHQVANRLLVVFFYPCDFVRVKIFNGIPVAAEPLVKLGQQQ